MLAPHRETEGQVWAGWALSTLHMALPMSLRVLSLPCSDCNCGENGGRGLEGAWAVGTVHLQPQMTKQEGMAWPCSGAQGTVLPCQEH